MIRSLVLASSSESLEDNASTDVALVRRNLTQESLQKSLEAGSNMWIDIVDPEPEEILWLESVLSLSSTVIADLLRVDRRPTLLVYHEYLFLSLFQPLSQGNAAVGKEIHCIIGDHFFVTVRKTDATALEEAYDRVAKNPKSWHRGVIYFLYLTAQSIIDTYYPFLDQVSNQLSTLETKLLNDSEDKQAQRSVYRIKQQLIKLRQMIGPQREVLSSLIGEQRVSNMNEDRELFRHLYERLLGIYDMIDSQRDLTNNVLDIIANQQSRRMGEAVNRLTIISIVFLPFAFFMGMFDSDFFNIGEPVILPVNGLVVAIVVTLMMIASIVIIRIVFQRRGWL